MVGNSKVFRRRQIESNWSRYEGLDDAIEHDDEVRGIDFATVVHVSGSIMIVSASYTNVLMELSNSNSFNKRVFKEYILLLC